MLLVSTFNCHKLRNIKTFDKGSKDGVGIGMSASPFDSCSCYYLSTPLGVEKKNMRYRRRKEEKEE